MLPIPDPGQIGETPGQRLGVPAHEAQVRVRADLEAHPATYQAEPQSTHLRQELREDVLAGRALGFCQGRSGLVCELVPVDCEGNRIGQRGDAAGLVFHGGADVLVLACRPVQSVPLDH